MLAGAAAGLLVGAIGVIVMARSPDDIPKPGPKASSSAVPSKPEDIDLLRQRHLMVPVLGVKRESLRDTFREQRGSDRRHEAIDIMSRLQTPVVAVEDGTIAKLFLSKPGGLTIYQFDPTETYAYYYAHLSRYADGLQEHTPVVRGQIIGYVGTTGNAPPDAPHLHFAIFRLTTQKRWWEGTPIDPYPVFNE
jgi:murein DD-endopeptidase MepM/ murein hydrolase activator NlpD